MLQLISRLPSFILPLLIQVASITLAALFILIGYHTLCIEKLFSSLVPGPIITVTDSDVPEPAMAVLLTIASSGDDEAETGNDFSDTLKHSEQIDALSDEFELLERESIAAVAAVVAETARLRFLRARRTFAQVSQAST